MYCMNNLENFPTLLLALKDISPWVDCNKKKYLGVTCAFWGVYYKRKS